MKDDAPTPAGHSHWLIRWIDRVLEYPVLKLFLEVGALYFLIAAYGGGGAICAAALYLIGRLHGSIYD